MSTRFLEESPGVLSMTRLAILLQVVAGFLVLIACIAVAVLAMTSTMEYAAMAAAGIIAALAAASAAAFAGAWAQARERHLPDDNTGA